jgi:hypothetical protein
MQVLKSPITLPHETIEVVAISVAPLNDYIKLEEIISFRIRRLRFGIVG